MPVQTECLAQISRDYRNLDLSPLPAEADMRLDCEGCNLHEILTRGADKPMSAAMELNRQGRTLIAAAHGEEGDLLLPETLRSGAIQTVQEVIDNEPQIPEGGHF